MTRNYVRKRLPVEPIRRAFEDSDLTLSDVCYRLGWTKNSRSRGTRYRLADTSRLKRALGLAPQTSGSHRLSRRISYDQAQRIAQALDLDPCVVDDWLPEPEPEPAGDHDRCPECGTKQTWTDSWNQERCERCWAIVAAGTKERAA